MNTSSANQKDSDKKDSDKKDSDKKEYSEIRLINQGTYGCVYKPEITCDGKVGNAHYISKIQLTSESIIHEQMIGSLILEKIPLSQQYFAPIVSICPVSMSNINEIEQNKCNIIDKKKPSKYSSSKIRFVGNNNIAQYLTSLPPDANLLIKKIQATYYHILTSLQKMNDIGIVHYDIKDNNILYDENNHSPIIIDFGISFISSDIVTANKTSIFYSTQYYPCWCIDVYILSNVINKLDNKVTKELLSELFNSFFENLVKYMQENSYTINNTERDMFKQKYDDYFKSFIGEPWQTVYDKWYNAHVYNSWDNYSCAIMYLLIINQLYYIEDGPLLKHTYKLPKPFAKYGQDDIQEVSGGFSNAEPIIENIPLNKQLIIRVYNELWKNIIFAMPEERLDAELTIQVILNI